MRPAGEIHQALLSAAQALSTPEQAPTLAEMAAHAQVGVDAARHTVPKMKQRGVLRIARTRRVDYRNRPVAEYEPVPPGAQAVDADDDGLARVLSAWVQR
jgi:hypothetical protein